MATKKNGRRKSKSKFFARVAAVVITIILLLIIAALVLYFFFPDTFEKIYSGVMQTIERGDTSGTRRGQGSMPSSTGSWVK